MDQSEKILTAVLEIKQNVDDLLEWRKKIDVIMEDTYNKLDGFLEKQVA